MTDGAGGPHEQGLSRRELVKRGAVGVGGLVLSGTTAQKVWARPTGYQELDADTTIKLGFVSPITGATAGFGEPDPYVLSLARRAFAKGLTVGGNQRQTGELLPKGLTTVVTTPTPRPEGS